MFQFIAECEGCDEVLYVEAKPDEVRLFSQIVSEDGKTVGSCPFCGRGTLALVAKQRAPVTRTMTLTAFYGASFGMAAPGQEPTTDRIHDLFKMKSVGQTVEICGPVILLHEIHFEDGSILHLCGSGRGAQVLKITKE